MLSDDLESFFLQALRMERTGDVSGALDVVYQSIDEALRDGRFQDVDSFMRGLNPAQLSTDMLLAILILSRAASDKILSREGFFERTWKILESRKEDARDLLGGLRAGPPTGETMSIAIWFWIIYVVAIVFTGITNWPASRSWGSWLVIFILLGILGAAQFGGPVK